MPDSELVKPTSDPTVNIASVCKTTTLAPSCQMMQTSTPHRELLP